MAAFKLGKDANNRQKKIIVSGFIALMLLHVIFTFAGFYGNDDVNYARYAAAVAHNGISFSPALDQFQLRWATVYSTAFFYWLIGINAFTSTLSATISFALCGILLYKILRHKKTGVFILSMVLFFFGRSIIFYSHRLLPDPTMCLAVLWMYFSYRSYILKKQQPLWYGIQFSIALFLAIITKETIIIALPLFFLFFLRDVFKKQNFQFWRTAILLSLFFSCAYLFYFKITTGNFFYRYAVLVNNSYFSICSFDKLPLIYTLKRIGYQLWRAMLLNGDFLVLIPGIAAVIYRKKIAYTGIKKMDTFSFLVLLACANFMTISATSYVPLCHDPRHFLFLFPFAAIIGGPMIHAFFKQPEKFVILPLFFVIATVTIFALNGGTTKYMFLLITLLFAGRYLISLFNIEPALYPLFVILFTLSFFMNYIVDFVKPSYPYFQDQKEVIENQFGEKNIDATVFSDPFSGELSEFILDFKTGDLNFFPLDSAKSPNHEPTYYLLIGDLYPAMREKTDSLLQKRDETGIQIISKKDNVYLFRVNDEVLQILKGN